jgi:hypothetical protein
MAWASFKNNAWWLEGLSCQGQALRYGLRLKRFAIAQAVEPMTSDEGKEKPIPD